MEASVVRVPRGVPYRFPTGNGFDRTARADRPGSRGAACLVRPCLGRAGGPSVLPELPMNRIRHPAVLLLLRRSRVRPDDRLAFESAVERQIDALERLGQSRRLSPLDPGFPGRRRRRVN